MFSDFSTYHSIPLITVPKIHTDLLWDFTFLFTGLGLVYFLVVFFFRNKLKKNGQEVARRKKELGPMISNFLFYEEDATNSEKVEYFNLKLEIRELLKDDLNRKVLVEILLDLQKDIAGDASRRLSDLYRNLGLHLDAFELLKSRRWEVVSRGILELTQLHVEESYGFIRKFINHKRGVIRNQAQLATVSLKHEGINYFLDTNKYQISEWQQLKLLDEIRNLENFKPPRFRAWLTSRNNDVVVFALRLIKFYKQNDANASLIELVKHRNNQIKIEAIECIKEFCVLEAMDTLKAVYGKCNAEVKIEILDAIGQMGEEEDIEFLRKAEKKEVNFLVRSKVISAINCITPGTILPTKDIISTSFPEEEPETEVGPPIPAICDDRVDPPPGDTEMQEELIPSPADSMKIPQPLEVMDEADEEAFKSSPTGEVSDATEEIPGEWELLLDLENEDTEIFEICFMEELLDILSEAASSEDPAQLVGVLPLDFLPMVTEEAVKQENRFPSIPEAILDLEVISEEVAEDAKFRLELDSMLQRIRVMEETGEVSLSQPYGDREINLGVIGMGQHNEDLLVAPADPEIPLNSAADDRQTIEAHPDSTGLHTCGPKNDEPSGEIQLLLPGKDELAVQHPSPEVFSEPLFYLTEDVTEITATDELETYASPEAKQQDMAATDTAYLSIFHELFRRADTESKLILLDEILAVGDEKELHFLIALTTSPNKALREKAILLSRQLQDIISRRHAQNSQQSNDEEFTERVPEPISGEGSTQAGQCDSYSDGQPVLMPLEECYLSDTGEPFNMFEVEFELIKEDPDPPGSDGNFQSPSHTLLDNILSIPVKIRDKFNG